MAAVLILGVKSDAFAGRIRRGEKLADGIEDDFELLVVVVFQNTDLAGQFLDGESEATQAKKGTDNGNAGQNGTGAVEDVGSHESPVFCKNERQVTASAPARV